VTQTPPETVSRSTHALLIRVSGRTVGAIYEWGTTQRRDLKPRWEVNLFGRGLPADINPGVLRDRSIRCSRIDLYDEVMEECFGNSELVMLTDQTRPLSIREVWLTPGTSTQIGADVARALGASGAVAAIAGGGINGLITVGAGSGRLYENRGCWFEEITRTLSANEDRVSRAQGTMQWMWKPRIQ